MEAVMEPLTQSGLQGTGRKVGAQIGGRDLYGVPSVTYFLLHFLLRPYILVGGMDG